MATAEKNPKAKSPQEIIKRVNELVSLAESDNENEATSAALQAVRMMKEHKLMVVPTLDVEGIKKMVEGAQALAKKAKAEKTQNMMIGALAGFLLGGKKIF